MYYGQKASSCDSLNNDSLLAKMKMYIPYMPLPLMKFIG